MDTTYERGRQADLVMVTQRATGLGVVAGFFEYVVVSERAVHRGVQADLCLC